MHQFILGIGREHDLVKIVETAQAELLVMHGPPQRLIVRGYRFELHASRSDYESPFDTLLVRMQLDESVLPKLSDIADDGSSHCQLTQQDQWHELTVKLADGESDAPRQALARVAALATLPEVWRVVGEGFREDRLSATALLESMVEVNASDVHLYPGAAPVLRIDGNIQKSDAFGILSAPQILQLLREIAPEESWREFEQEMQCGFRYHHVGLGFARVSAFMKGQVPHFTLRHLPEAIPSFDDLKIPADLMQEIAGLPLGLVLVTGMTGSGKSTTVAALIDWINQNDFRHVLTIEEPIEYVHANKWSVVSQREVGVDVNSFSEAVRGALRHDPDVIFIGEMRDADTIRSAINAASTGHLVLSTMHSNTTAEVINRIVSFFDPIERDLVRLQIRDCLRCVVCQRFVPKVDGGRIAAVEFLFNDTKDLGDAIQAGDTESIRVAMQQSVSRSTLMEENLVKLVKEKTVDAEEAKRYAANADIYEQMQLGTYSVPSLEAMASLRKSVHGGKRLEF